jgi:RNA polymerase sigma-70 factor (ECF subfamily)
MMECTEMNQSEMVTEFEELRPLLFSIAYRMLGSVSEAEDIVQEAYLRWHHVSGEGSEIESPKAYLSAVVTRLSIDHLRSARVRRERYVGQWLPEPLLTDIVPDAGEHAVLAESLSMAFLVLLESLSPVERAVFLLHDIFGYEYDEIARIVGKSEQNCRQLAVRARRRVEERRPRFEVPERKQEELARTFFAAMEQGDTTGLIHLLADDVVVYGDGGGKAPSWPHPIEGRGRVSHLLAGIGSQMHQFGLSIKLTALNGQPGALFLNREGRITNVMVLDIAGDAVRAVRSVINPEKLSHLGPVADVRGLLREHREQTSDGTA